MKKSRPKRSFDELVTSYYGDDGGMRAPSARFEALLARHYGAPVTARGPARRDVARAQSFDDGEVLRQRPCANAPREYVLSLGLAADAASSDEYVVGDAGPRPVPLAGAASLALEAASAEEVPPAQEYLVDVRAPLGEPAPAATPPALPAPEPRIEAPPAESAAPRAVAQSQSPAAAPLRRMTEEPPPQQASEDDFMADMQSILTGRKVFDPASGRTVERDRLAPAARERAPEPTPEVSSSQAIFDRIARSMEFANAFDLGTVELNNRFSDFDRIAELQQRAAAEKRARNQQAAAAPAPAPTSDTADFIEDLEAIRGNRAEPGYSKPFYDTGEHVLAADDQYVDQLRLGRSPGVGFSYGEIIALGDMYESVDQMMAAAPLELKALKHLIRRSTAYHRGGRTDKSLDVADELWDAVTRDRYLELAEQNYEHFSPILLFKANTLVQRGDHRASWEKHHRWALDEVSKLYADPANAGKSLFLEWPLIINAFGDHFLTDAFSAGHLINKQEIIETFKDAFYSGKSLRSEAQEFFAKVAGLAFKGEVRKKFSVLETYEPVFLWWNPNIDTENAFRKLLVGIAEQRPDAIANLAVKALHDRLNRDGVEVQNDVRPTPWVLTGDSHLEHTTNLPILRAAVKQSIANLEDPALTNSSVDADVFVARVWRHVPRPTPASRAKLVRLATEYTRPDSTTLREAAAEIITKRVDSFIKKLKKEKKLKDA